MPKLLTLAASQSHTLPTTPETLLALEQTAKLAASKGVHLLLYPEAYLGHYPRTCNFGAAVGERTHHGRDQFLAYYQGAIDLGDTPRGAGDDWVERKLEGPRGSGENENREGGKVKRRGDGVREEVERVARETGVFLVVGVVERAGGSLYCAVIYVDPRRGCIGKRRKVMPTGAERLVWAQGGTEGLRAVVATLGGSDSGGDGVRVCLAAAICWENFMPLLRWSLYAQNVNLWLAPTADGRDTWLPLMRTVAGEGRCVVVSANQCVRRRDLPGWITEKGEGEEEGEKKKVEAKGGMVSEGKRRKSVRMETVDGHEIVLPRPKLKEENDENVGESKKDPAAINGTSPLRFSKISADDEATTSNPLGENAPDSHILALPSGKEEKSASISSAAVDNEEDDDDEFVSRGGSCIIGPTGDVLAGPLWEVDEGGLLIATVDFEDCERGRLDLDVAGHYGRLDSFELKVKGLDLSPPP